jgi:gas vesicle protein GvpL/GvpF
LKEVDLNMPRSGKPVRKSSTPAQVLYLYAISDMLKRAVPVIAAEAIDGSARVEAIRCGDYLCWCTRVSAGEFGDGLNERMQNLEWLAMTSLRHQRVVAEISSNTTALPARFGTVFLSEDSLAKHVQRRKKGLREALDRVADADEWGVKVFATAVSAKTAPVPKPASGSDYLKRKAELLQPRTRGKLDGEVQEFIAALTKLAAATSPGGKASAGQPGLLWHGSFLIRRNDRKKLDAALRKYAAKWKDARRIDCSGPWPPYSFVGEHVQ